MDFRSLEDSLLQDYAQTHKPTARDRIKEIEAQVHRARNLNERSARNNEIHWTSPDMTGPVFKPGSSTYDFNSFNPGKTSTGPGKRSPPKGGLSPLELMELEWQSAKIS